MDTELYKDIFAHVEVMKAKGTISPNDTELFYFTDNVDDAVDYIRINTIKKYNLEPKEKLSPFKWLFEKE